MIGGGVEDLELLDKVVGDFCARSSIEEELILLLGNDCPVELIASIFCGIKPAKVWLEISIESISQHPEDFVM